MGGYQYESWVYVERYTEVLTVFGVKDDLPRDDGVIYQRE